MTGSTDIGGLPSRPGVLTVAPWIFHPNCGMGGGALCFEMLRHLSRFYDIHFVSFDTTANDPEAGKRALASFCSSVSFVPLPPLAGRSRRWARQILTAVPWEASAFASAEMAERLRKIVADRKPAVALVQFPQVAQYIPVLAGTPVIMDVQDACMASRFREWRRTDGRIRRIAKMLTWMAWAAHEKKHYANASALLALSENDHGVLSSFVPEVPCFLSPVAAHVSPHAATKRDRYVAFVGNFGHPPNLDALKWLLGVIWPKVRRQVPDAELRVAGPSIPPDVHTSAAAGVRVLGFVDELGALLDRAAVAVVPYRFGGGVKIKALDAMARGCPVVATTVGAEGLRVERGRHLLVEDDAERFASAVSSLLESEELQTRLGEAGRAHVETTFSWSAKTAGLVAVIEGLRCRESDQDSCARPRSNARSSESRIAGFMPPVGSSAGAKSTVADLSIPMSSAPYFSLVVPTLGRTADPTRLFESLASSTCRDFECILVDQNRDERLEPVVARYRERFPLRHLRVEFSGAARARNYGARYATGSVLNFPDDDCELTPTLLTDVRARLDAHPVKILIGMCVDRDGAASTTRFALDERSLSAWSMWNRNIEFTMFFDRATFAAAGGYDERFGVGAAFGSDEGAELLIRLLRTLPPGQVRYDHRLRFFHPDKAADWSPAGLARAYSYARGSGALLAKWPSAPVFLHSARLLAGAVAGAGVSRGDRRAVYLGRLRGFVKGFAEYRARYANGLAGERVQP